ncbi:MAG: hypothetical protein GY798_21490 [Hyphomicrobiales bacterium]|nr:hypothetical protein [Hyphomicrobiales bacterium]
MAEVVAGAGTDFIVIDAEHAPNTVPSVLEQMRAVSRFPVDILVRPRSADPNELKQFLDIGARNLLMPFVETAEQAEQIVTACVYPPQGKRGVSMGHRSNGFGRHREYFERAKSELCLIPQIETVAAVEQLEAIAIVPGISAVFVGPADLAADLGHVGQPNHPEFLDLLSQIAMRCRAMGVPFGTLVPGVEQALKRRDLGASFVAVGTDIGALVSATDSAVNGFGRWKQQG